MTYFFESISCVLMIVEGCRCETPSFLSLSKNRKNRKIELSNSTFGSYRFFASKALRDGAQELKEL